jgi:outer membrane protein assembly factor BamB
VALSVLTVALGIFQVVRGDRSGEARRAAVQHRDATPRVSTPPVSVPLLRTGSDPTVLPGPLLIADRGNDRLLEVDPHGRVVWSFPRPGDLAPGQTFHVPDDAFFSADGKYIVATQEDDFVFSVIDVAKHRIVWRYGTPGVPGSGPNRLWNPDDAMLLRDRHVVVADIKNCRVLVIPFGAHTPSRVFGDGRCRHAPPDRLGSPNGAFPNRSGNLVVTEINGNWVDEMTRDGKVALSVHPPRVAYPSDTSEIAPGVYLTADYSDPGAVVIFDRKGRERWRFAPRDADALRHPSLALPLPNGDFLVTDDGGHRVVVVDPTTNRVVWQYGQTGRPGSGPGFLRFPDGVDLAPPYSYLHRVASG